MGVNVSTWPKMPHGETSMRFNAEARRCSKKH
jgi:hypothetical protein